MDENSALTLCKAEYSYSSGMVYGGNVNIQITVHPTGRKILRYGEPIVNGVYVSVQAR